MADSTRYPPWEGLPEPPQQSGDEDSQTQGVFKLIISPGPNQNDFSQHTILFDRKIKQN